MHEYIKDGKVVVKSNGSKNVEYTSIMIEVFGVPFMAGWKETKNIVTLECVVEEIMRYFGSLSVDIYRCVVCAYKDALDDVR